MIDYFHRLRIAAPVFLLILSACSGGLQSYSYKAKGVDLKQYRSYAWVKPGNEDDEVRKDDKLYSGTILRLSNEELTKKGFVLDTESPDAVFMFDTRLEEQVAYSQTPQMSVGVGFGGPGYYGGFSAPVAGGQVVAENYTQGMLFVEMYDTKTQKLLWRGWAQEKITYANDIEADIRLAVRHIFQRLPVKHK